MRLLNPKGYRFPLHAGIVRLSVSADFLKICKIKSFALTVRADDGPTLLETRVEYMHRRGRLRCLRNYQRPKAFRKGRGDARDPFYRFDELTSITCLQQIRHAGPWGSKRSCPGNTLLPLVPLPLNVQQPLPLSAWPRSSPLSCVLR